MGMPEVLLHGKRIMCFSELQLWRRGLWEMKQVRIQQETSEQHVQMCPVSGGCSMLQECRGKACFPFQTLCFSLSLGKLHLSFPTEVLRKRWWWRDGIRIKAKTKEKQNF